MEPETNIEKLMECFDITWQMSNEWYIKSLDKSIQNGYINLIDLKNELHDAIEDKEFEWITNAIKFNLIYTTKEQFSEQDLIDYLKSNIWNWCLEDERPTAEEKHLIENTFRQIPNINQNNINYVFDRKEFDWLNFGIKQQFKIRFSIEEYENRDIIHHLKSMCWDYLFPGFYSPLNKKKDSNFAQDLLKNANSNNGWMNCDLILNELDKIYSNKLVDEYYISNLNWTEGVQHKNNERNQFALGYKRIKTVDTRSSKK